MAPVGQLGGANVATFHGIPNTTGLPLPAGAMFEMPKLPLMPQTPTMNA